MHGDSRIVVDFYVKSFKLRIQQASTKRARVRVEPSEDKISP